MDWLIEHLDLADLMTRLVAFLPKLGAAILIFTLFMVGYRLTRPAFQGALKRIHLHEKLVELLVDTVYRYAVLVIALVMALDQVGVNMGAAFAGIGAVGIALGFAAQDTLSNLISGFMIFMDKPFVVGDWIEAEGQRGQVSDITLRTTRIRTARNTYVVVPNKSIINSVLENHSKNGDVRVDVPIGIAYKENIGKAKKVILETVSGLEMVKGDPEPQVVVTELANSSVNLSVRTWVGEAGDAKRVHYEILEKCKVALDDADIEIPFPHLQLFLEDVDSRVWSHAQRLSANARAA